MTRQTRKTKTKLTQTEIAERLGISREHLNRVLQGVRTSRRLMRAYRQVLSGKPPTDYPRPS